MANPLQSVRGLLGRAPKEINVGISWPGKRFQFDVQSSIRVSELKQLLEQASEVPTEVMHFSYRGKFLKDHRTLAHYRIKNDRTILLTRLDAEVRPRSPEPQRKSFKKEAKPPDQFLSAISLPAESGRFSNQGMLSHKAASQREEQGKFETGASINNFLDDWFAGKPAPNDAKQQQQQQQGQQQQGGEQGLAVGEAQAGGSAKASEGDANPVDEEGEVEAKGGEGEGPEQDKPPAEPEYVPVKVNVKPANPNQVNVFAAMLRDSLRAPQPVLAPDPEPEGEQGEPIKFTVRCGKKEVKLKMLGTQDMWAVKLQLEAAKAGQAGQMVLFDADGEELDEEGTLEENDIVEGARLVMHLQS